jgi:hypothetical protein
VDLVRSHLPGGDAHVVVSEAGIDGAHEALLLQDV